MLGSQVLAPLPSARTIMTFPVLPARDPEEAPESEHDPLSVRRPAGRVRGPRLSWNARMPFRAVGSHDRDRRIRIGEPRFESVTASRPSREKLGNMSYSGIRNRRFQLWSSCSAAGSQRAFLVHDLLPVGRPGGVTNRSGRRLLATRKRPGQGDRSVPRRGLHDVAPLGPRSKLGRHLQSWARGMLPSSRRCRRLPTRSVQVGPHLRRSSEPPRFARDPFRRRRCACHRATTSASRGHTRGREAAQILAVRLNDIDSELLGVARARAAFLPGVRSPDPSRTLSISRRATRPVGRSHLACRRRLPNRARR